MATLDIRTIDEDDVIDTIVFSDRMDSTGDWVIAHTLQVNTDDYADNRVLISDGAEDVIIAGATHAKNLIKALEKAIELKMLT